MAMLLDKDGISLTRVEEGVLQLTLNRNANEINPTAVTLLIEAIEAVEQAPHPKALVITGMDKFFSNGLDVKWMGSVTEKESSAMLEGFWRFLGRLLVLDCPTVAAINGHAFGAGIFLALACDWRIMRTERGFANFPELNLGMRLSKAFAELAKSKLGPSTLRTGVLTGKRFSSTEALAAGIIDMECPMEKLTAEACEMAKSKLPKSLGLARFNAASFKSMKIELYTDAYLALTKGKTTTQPDSVPSRL